MEEGIRHIRDSDILPVAAIYNHYVEHTVVSYEEACVGYAEMLSRVNGVLEAGYPWLVAEVDGRISGYAYAFAWSPRKAYRHTAEVTVYLSRDETRKGWGTRLYSSLFDLLQQRGTRTVIGGIGLPNPGSIALHEKMGMSKVAHFPRVGYKFDQWLDVGYWQRDFMSEAQE